MSDRGQFAGRVIAQQTVAGVTLAEIVHERARSLPLHSHRDPYFCLIATGRYEDTVTARLRTFAPADAMFAPPGFEHRDRIGVGGVKFFAVSFAPDAGEFFTDRRRLWTTTQRWNASGPSLLLTRLHLDFLRSGGRLDALDVETRLLEIWSGIGASHAMECPHAAWLEGARARLHDEFALSPRIADLAKDAGVHPTHFARAFRARYGLGPAEYRTKLRVTAACRALADRRSIRQVAVTLGYADPAHFSRDFLARVGVTPATYQRLIAPEMKRGRTKVAYEGGERTTPPAHDVRERRR